MIQSKALEAFKDSHVWQQTKFSINSIVVTIDKTQHFNCLHFSMQNIQNNYMIWHVPMGRWGKLLPSANDFLSLWEFAPVTSIRELAPVTSIRYLDGVVFKFRWLLDILVRNIKKKHFIRIRSGFACLLECTSIPAGLFCCCCCCCCFLYLEPFLTCFSETC